MCKVGVLLLMIVFSVTSSNKDMNEEYTFPIDDNIQEPFETDEEYIQQIYSMIDAYRGDVLGGRLVIETNALIDTKYKTWKRNADLINSLLALPKGMNDAGR